ncbi:AMP-binding protein [Subtercola endophyticus]|uniref:AMP-binding protein n=1 Tax=Subtercola endophyticus TaxID=2895559 RepID=UPI001E65B8DF|nr:AMP-binding protein [Subtercola endophyticus]UFS58135.1 AMP-binding protein [Subtercola endophyticus]
MTTTEANHALARYTPQQIEAFENSGQWDAGTLASYIDDFAIAAPHKIALTDGYESLTRGELHDRSRRLALSLKNLGITHGDRVQVQLPNWNEFAVIYLALARLGAILVPTMPVYRDDEVKFVIDNSGAKMSIVTSNFRHFDYVTMIEGIRAVTPALENVIVVRGAASASTLAYDDLIAGEHVPTDAELGRGPSSEDTHAIIYTSGTESRPKGCEHTFATMAFTARRLAADVFQLTEDDVMLMPTPITHATGLAAGLMMPLLYGASIHLVDVWEPHDALHRIAEYGTTVSMSATPFLQMTLGALKTDPTHDMSSMRVWASAGAPIPESMLRAWRDLAPGCLALPVYGNSEALIVTAMQHDDPAEKALVSDGRPADGVTLEIRDEAGAAVTDGSEGEIVFRSPGLLLGYWNDPQKTAGAIGADGFFASGDLGKVTDGYLRVTGRIKDLIIRGGLNISAREVEENAAYHPAITAVAAVSMPDERLGEKVCAFIVAAGDEQLTIGELAAFLQGERHIAAHKCPERIIYIDELPTTATGKVKKFELRQRAAV